MSSREISSKIEILAAECEQTVSPRFSEIDRVAEENTKKILNAFRDNRVSDICFSGTTGYGYNDLGRETLDKVFAQVFDCDSALVRTGFVNGTHAIASALFGAVSPGDSLLSILGAPYDTIQTAIGLSKKARGTLIDYGVKYAQIEPDEFGMPDYESIKERVSGIKPAAVFIQRSCGYSTRKTLSISEISNLCAEIKNISPETKIIVDNCYGEFTETLEPTSVGADIIAGSLIKNPGGGLAPMGGYIAGDTELVENSSFRLTVPGIGGDCGATLGANRLLFQGLFFAPHTVAQALKTAIFCAELAKRLGYESSPGPFDLRSDIIQRIKFNTAEKLKKFCRGLQAGSPIDSFVTPEPWGMPGYDCDVIMAAGTFIQGASIELSADGPMKEPYYAFVQGGLTYESGKYGIISAFSALES